MENNNLFKKLQDRIELNNIHNAPISDQERDRIESSVIFGNMINNIATDIDTSSKELQ